MTATYGVLLHIPHKIDASSDASPATSVVNYDINAPEFVKGRFECGLDIDILRDIDLDWEEVLCLLAEILGDKVESLPCRLCH